MPAESAPLGLLTTRVSDFESCLLDHTIAKRTTGELSYQLGLEATIFDISASFVRPQLALLF